MIESDTPTQLRTSTVAPLPAQDWDPSLAPVLADMKGSPLNVHGLMAHHPELLKAWWSFRNHSVGGGELGRRSSELVILRVAVHLRAWYEWASHVDRSLACGLALEEIERVLAGPDAPGWEDQDRILLRAVDELVRDRLLSEPTYAALAARYSLRQIMDLMAIQGMYVILGCMIKTWDLALDGAVAERLPAGVTRERFDSKASGS